MNKLTITSRCLLTASIALTLGMTYATENGASVYPGGVETIVPGMLPPSGQTMILEFNNFYQANGVAGRNGLSEVPGFHLRVAAEAAKYVHNWGVHVLGGRLVSSLALPLVTIHLSAPFGNGTKAGMGNPDIGVAAIAYNKGTWHYWYGVDVFTPGAEYDRKALINVGQHNSAVSPQGAFTYLPHAGAAEFSSKFQ